MVAGVFGRSSLMLNPIGKVNDEIEMCDEEL